MRYAPTFLAAAAILILAAVGQGQEPAAGRPITVEVLFADVPAAAVDGDVTAAKVLDLAKQGKVESTTTIKLALLENQQGSIQFGETVPLVTGRQSAPEGFPGGRGGGATYSMQNVGTSVEATSRIEQDGTIVVQLSAQQSRLPKPRPAADGEAAPAIESRRISQTTTRTTVRLKSGQPEIVGGQAVSAGESAVHTYLVVTAAVPEGAKAAAAAEATVKVFALSHARAADLVQVIRTAAGNVPLRIAADERSNSLVVSGPSDALPIVEALIVRLDGE